MAMVVVETKSNWHFSIGGRNENPGGTKILVKRWQQFGVQNKNSHPQATVHHAI